MADFTALKTAIQNAIKQNGNNAITGNLLQDILISMVSTLGDSAINGLVSSLSTETTNRQNADGTLQSAINTINTKLSDGYTYLGIATPTTNPSTTSGKVFYIATTAGTYTNFHNSSSQPLVLTQGINILKFNGTSWSVEQVWRVDDVPTAASNNLVKSGGVQNELALGAVYDVSAKNPTAGPNNDGKWESLSALLSDANLNTLIPTSVRKGGMSIKYVCSSDNKYVQYRCVADEFTTDVTQWQGVDDVPTAGSDNLVKSGGVEDKISVLSGNILSYNLPIPYDAGIGIYYDTGYYVGDFKSGETLLLEMDDVNNIVTQDELIYVSSCEKDATNRVWLADIHLNNKYYIKLNRDVKYICFLSTALMGSGNLVVSVSKVGSTIYRLDELEEMLGKGKNYVQGYCLLNETTVIPNSDFCFSKKIYLTDDLKNNGLIFYIGTHADRTRFLYAYLFDENGDPLGRYGIGENTDHRRLTSSDLQGCSYIILNFVNGYNARITPYNSEIENVWEAGLFDAYEIRMQAAERGIEQNDGIINDVQRAYENKTYFTKHLVLNGNLDPNLNTFPITIKKGSVFSLNIQSESIQSITGIYFNDKTNTTITRKYNIYPNTKYSFEATDDIASFSINFDKTKFKTGYTSGDVTLYVDVDETKKVLTIPVLDKLQTIELNRKECDCISVRFTGDVTKTTQVTGIYLYNEDVELARQYNLSLNTWYTFGKFDNYITKIEVYTTASKVTEENTIAVDIKYSNAVVSDIAYQNKDVIEAALDNRLVVPDYYFTNNYLQNKVARINKLAQEAGDDAFIFTTDEHWEYNAKVTPAIIKYLDKKCSISKLISTGDHTQHINNQVNNVGTAEVNKASFDYASLHELATRKPRISSIGNHEYHSIASTGVIDGTNLNNWVRYAYYTDYSDVVAGNSEKMYFYKDDKVKKLRYIFLNNFTSYHVEAVAGNRNMTVADAIYGSEQLDWFANTALNVESGYGIIIITHWLVQYNAPNQTSNEFNIYIPQSATTGIKDLANIIMNYSGNGEIIAVLTGHLHRDIIEVVDDVFAQNDSEHLTHNAFIDIGTTCDAGFFPEASLPTEYMPYRVAGTISECAFDFCILNRSKHRFDFIRIGYPASIRLYYNDTLEERAFVYQMQNVAAGGTKSLEHDITGTAVWNSSNTSIATVSDGVVTGVSAGIAKITVEDTTNHRAIVYMVKVS